MSGPTRRWVPQDQAVRDRLAGALETSFAVGAGAGSGKTKVLVDRVIELVDQGSDLDSIVAMTFTEKAAAELRERVRDILATVPESGSGEVEERRLAALGKVDLSQLTTIHGFCRSILASHPLEAGITPGFRVLDQLESDLLLDAAASEEIARLQQDDSEALEGALLAGGNLTGLRELAHAVGRYPDLEPELPGAPEESIEEVIAALLDTARLIVSYADVIPAKDSLLQQAGEALRQEPYLIAEGLDIHDRATALERVRIYKNVGAKANWDASGEVREAFTRLKPAWIELQQRRDVAVAGYKGEQLAYLIQQAECIRDNYEGRKAELGGLDFDDLLLRTEKLLETEPPVAEQIKRSYRHILVDEFQDTDPVQAWIVQRLAEAVEKRARRIEDAVPGRGRLFLVGDANQGIYRFRRADLSVFQKARTQLLKEGEEARLEVNFRSTPRLVAVANRIFPDLLTSGEYRDLIAHRKEDAQGPSVSLLDLDTFLGNGKGGRSGGKDPSIHEVRIAEARALAGWIQDRIGAGWTIFDEEMKEWRPVTYRDIAVLVRTYTGVPIFEDELERCGIPYRASGGRAFFQRLEVLQTMPVLRAIADPGDEVAVVAALRSLYFGVSDESLVRWAGSGRPFTYLDSADRPVDDAFIEEYLDREADAPLIQARTLLAGLHHEAALRPPSGLFRKLYELTRALPLHALKPDGDRRMANLLKLSDLAAAYEEAAASLMEEGAGEIGSLDGLVRYLEEQRRAAAEEESALVDEAGDGLNLMTIHSAKGLEFPVVAILDRSYATKFRDRAIANRAQGTATVCGAGLEPPVWKERKEAEEVEQEAEARRLMYVAFTRARDHVVLCGQRSGGCDEKGFLAPLEAALRGLAEEGEGGGTSLVEWVAPSAPVPRREVPHRLPYDVEEPSAEEIEQAVRRRRQRRDDWQAAVSRARRSLMTRSSQLAAHREFVPPVSVGAAGSAGAEEGGEAITSGWYARLRGTRVHAAMELAALYGTGAEEAGRAVSEPGDPTRVYSEICALVACGITLLEEARVQGWRVVATEWPLLLGSAYEMLPEIVDEGIEVLTGTADLILEDPEENLLVVDYKTGRAGSRVLRKLYRGQLQAYRTMLEKSAQRTVSAEIWSLARGERIQLL